jgi:hypothetical protein
MDREQLCIQNEAIRIIKMQLISSFNIQSGLEIREISTGGIKAKVNEMKCEGAIPRCT